MKISRIYRNISISTFTLEQDIFLAKEERKEVEQEIIQDIITYVGMLRPRISFMAQMIAAIDFIQCSAIIATKCAVLWMSL